MSEIGTNETAWARAPRPVADASGTRKRRQGELHRRVVSADAARRRDGEAEDGGRVTHERGRERKVEPEGPHDAVDLDVDDEPHGERARPRPSSQPGVGSSARRSRRGRPRTAAGARGRQRRGQDAEQAVEEALGGSRRRKTARHEQGDDPPTRDERRGTAPPRGRPAARRPAARAGERASPRKKKTEARVEDALEDDRGEQGREGQASRPREERGPDDLAGPGRQECSPAKPDGRRAKGGQERHAAERAQDPDPARRRAGRRSGRRVPVLAASQAGEAAAICRPDLGAGAHLPRARSADQRRETPGARDGAATCEGAGIGGESLIGHEVARGAVLAFERPFA